MKNLSLEDLNAKLKPLNEDAYITLLIVEEYFLSLADSENKIDKEAFDNAINKCKNYGLLSDDVLPNVISYLNYHGIQIESKVNSK